MTTDEPENNPYSTPASSDSADVENVDSEAMRQIRALRHQVRYLYLMILALMVALGVAAESSRDPDLVFWAILAGVSIGVLSLLFLKSRSLR